MPSPAITRRLRLSGLLQDNKKATSDGNNQFQVSIRLPQGVLQKFGTTVCDNSDLKPNSKENDNINEVNGHENDKNDEIVENLIEKAAKGQNSGAFIGENEKIADKSTSLAHTGVTNDSADDSIDENSKDSTPKRDHNVENTYSVATELIPDSLPELLAPTESNQDETRSISGPQMSLIQTEEASDSELSSLDQELNHVLTSGTLPTTSPIRNDKVTNPQDGIEEISDEIDESDDDDGILQQTDVPLLPPQAQSLVSLGSFRTRLQRAGNSAVANSALEIIKPKIEPNTEAPNASKEELKGYRTIPQPYLSLMKRELSLFTDLNNEDELSMIQKVIFSLKDPYSGTKIQLPIKSTSCKHFECFDFKTFCQINESKISAVDQIKLRKELCSKNFEARKLEKLFQEQMKKFGTNLNRIQVPNRKGQPPLYTYPQYSENGQIFHFALFNKTPPLFKCPICDQLFGIKQLYISDVFNYFVKVTPKSVERIELLDMIRYRIIDNNPIKNSASPGPSEQEEVIILSDDSSDEEIRVHRSGSKRKLKPYISSESEDAFNDGLDDMIMNLTKPEEGNGAGSWDDPVTLDDD